MTADFGGLKKFLPQKVHALLTSKQFSDSLKALLKTCDTPQSYIAVFFSNSPKASRHMKACLDTGSDSASSLFLYLMVETQGSKVYKIIYW